MGRVRVMRVVHVVRRIVIRIHRIRIMIKTAKPAVRVKLVKKIKVLHHKKAKKVLHKAKKVLKKAVKVVVHVAKKVAKKAHKRVVKMKKVVKKAKAHAKKVVKR